MIRNRVIVVASLTLMTLLVTLVDVRHSRPAHAQIAGRVGGVVVNGTPGGTVPAGFEVVLLTVDNGGNVVDQKVTRVDDRGVFEFAGVRSNDVVNRVVADYQGVITTIRIEDEIAPANLKVEIYETTRSLESIEVVSHALVVRPDASIKAMGILEFVTFKNSGDRTFVTDLTDPSVTGLSMFRFGLPPGYEGLSGISIDPPLPAGQLIEVGPGFALTNPIPPGEFRLLFEYFIPYDGSSLEFTKNLPFGARELRLLLLKEAGEVTAEGLESGEDVTLGLSVYSVMRGTDYPRGHQVALKFGKLPEPPLWQRIVDGINDSSAVVKFGVPAVAGVALAGLLGYVLVVRRRGRQDPLDVPPDGAPEASGPDRAALVQQIAELDTRFEAGEMEESEYRSRRSSLVDQATAGPSDKPTSGSAG